MGAVLDGGHSGLLAALQALAALLLLFALFWAAKRGAFSLRSQRGQSATMHVEERIALDLKSGLVIVRVGERRLLLATADAQPARLICELGARPERADGSAPTTEPT